jgi:hypothetical protein
VGQVVETTDGRLRARLAADLVRLQFLRVMRSHPGTSLDDSGDLIGPPWPLPDETEDQAAPEGALPDEAPSRQQRHGRSHELGDLRRHIWTYRAIFLALCGVIISDGSCRWALAKAGCPDPTSCLR